MPTIAGVVVSTGAESNNRRTLSDVASEMARTINGADETIIALASDAFRAAVHTMNLKGNWPWEMLDEDLVISANNSFTTCIGVIKKPLSMHYTEGAGGVQKQTIGYVPYARFLEGYNLNLTGSPQKYTIPNMFETGQIRWFPIPPAADNARFNYYRATPAPRRLEETIEIPEHAIQGYMGYAWLEFCMRLSSRQRPFPIEVALRKSEQSFKELSAHVSNPGDMTRAGGPPYGYW